MILAGSATPELNSLIPDLIFKQIEIHSKTKFENFEKEVAHLYSIIISLELAILYQRTINQSAVDEIIKEIPKHRNIATAINLVFKFDENFKRVLRDENQTCIHPDVIYGEIIYSILQFQQNLKSKTTNDFETLCK